MKKVTSVEEIRFDKYYLECVHTMGEMLYVLYYKTPKHYVALDLSEGDRLRPEYRKDLSSFIYSLEIEFKDGLGKGDAFYEFNTKREAKAYLKKSKLKDKLVK